MTCCVEQLNEVGLALPGEVTHDGPRERALEARRTRNTGPPVGRYRLDGKRAAGSRG